MPSSLLSWYSPLNGLSVPFMRVTRYCSEVSWSCHSASVFWIFLGVSVMARFYHANRPPRARPRPLLWGRSRGRREAGTPVRSPVTLFQAAAGRRPYSRGGRPTFVRGGILCGGPVIRRERTLCDFPLLRSP